MRDPSGAERVHATSTEITGLEPIPDAERDQSVEEGQSLGVAKQRRDEGIRVEAAAEVRSDLRWGRSLKI